MNKEKLDKFLKEYVELNEKIKKMEQQQHYIKELTRSYLKDNNLNKIDENNIIVTLSSFEKETIDKKSAQTNLTPEQYKSILKVTNIEVIKIMDKDTFERCKGFKKSEV